MPTPTPSPFRRRLGYFNATLFLFYLLNLALFVSCTIRDNGDALSGKVESNRYFVHGKQGYTQVPKQAWQLNRAASYTALTTLALIFPLHFSLMLYDHRQRLKTDRAVTPPPTN